MPGSLSGDRTALREGLIAAAFVLLCALALFTVVLPELRDEPEDPTDAAEPTAEPDTP